MTCEEKCDLISANLDRPGLFEWSVHVLGPDDVHPCGSRSEAEALAEETNILAGRTNKGRGDDEFVSYAAYVVPRFKADKEAEQRRKDAERAEPVAWRWRKLVRGAQAFYTPWYHSAYNPFSEYRRPLGQDFIIQPLYTGAPDIVALKARVRELEEILVAKDRKIAEAVAAERERCAKIVESHCEVSYETGGNGLRPRNHGNIAGLPYAAAIREGGEHG